MPLSSVVGASSILKPGVCTSSTRPAVPFEGQTIYETDTDLLLTYDGSSWVAYRKAAAGQVLQVVSTAKTDTFATTSTSFTAVTGLSAAITPSSTSSKILVFVSMYGNITATGIMAQSALFRGATQIALGDAASNRTRSFSAVYGADVANILSYGGVFLDSPNTTSSTTYEVRLRSTNGSYSAVIGRSASDTDATGTARVPSSITLLEVSA